MKQVRIAYKPHPAVTLDKLNALQGDLKELTDENYEKLKTEIDETGFSFSPHCWKDKNGKLWLVDGHQRLTALKRMKEDGFKIPKIPFIQVEAANLKEAKRRVLQGVSQYGHVTDKGLTDFIEQANLKFDFVKDHFDLPHIDFKKISLPKKNKKSKEVDGLGEPSKLLHKCPNCGHKFTTGPIENLTED